MFYRLGDIFQLDRANGDKPLPNPIISTRDISSALVLSGVLYSKVLCRASLVKAPECSPRQTLSGLMSRLKRLLG